MFLFFLMNVSASELWESAGFGDRLEKLSWVVEPLKFLCLMLEATNSCFCSETLMRHAPSPLMDLLDSCRERR